MRRDYRNNTTIFQDKRQIGEHQETGNKSIEINKILEIFTSFQKYIPERFCNDILVYVLKH
jgi:hypothetical protein